MFFNKREQAVIDKRIKLSKIEDAEMPPLTEITLECDIWSGKIVEYINPIRLETVLKSGNWDQSICNLCYERGVPMDILNGVPICFGHKIQISIKENVVQEYEYDMYGFRRPPRKVTLKK